MDGDASGRQECPSYPPASYVSCFARAHWEDMPHIPGQYHNLVSDSCRTCKERQTGTGRTQKSLSLLFSKKMALFCTEIDFLGHRISANGVEADASKVKQILDWPIPASSSDICSFLGLVRYLDQFLPHLVDHTRLLTPLTTKGSELKWPGWTTTHQEAFDTIKCLVMSQDCLTTVNHDNLGNNKVFVTCDASDWRMGAMLSIGPTPQTAQPVAFNSMQLREAQLNYPVHKKELLAIVHALKNGIWNYWVHLSLYILTTEHLKTS